MRELAQPLIGPLRLMPRISWSYLGPRRLATQ